MIKLCRLDAVPRGEMRCVAYLDRGFLVAHTADGIFVADEMCTHEDYRLCEGNLTGTLVKCPLHGSRFDLTTGQVLDDPAEVNLVVYPVTVSNGSIFVTLP